MSNRTAMWDLVNLAIALVLLAAGAYIGLVVAPPEREMGDVYRIMYVHVPAAWMALLALTACFGASIVYLVKASWKWDAFAEASAEVGVFFGCLLLVLGSIWARPTWNTYWTWDPRLTTAAIMVVAFMGYLALRRFVDDPERRASWAAVVAILAFADIPIVWYSVKWWRSMHQLQSSPATVDPQMVIALRVSAFAFLAVLILFLRVRYRIALRQREAETREPDAEPGPAPVSSAGGAP